jgi:hypothetical protein
MKYEIINIIEDYKERKVHSKEAMDLIMDLMIPNQLENDEVKFHYIKRLVAFMWNIEVDDLINKVSGKRGDTTLFKAKCCFTKILSYGLDPFGKKLGRVKLARLLGVGGHDTVGYRLKQHDIFYDAEEGYRTIYDIIKKVTNER